MQNIMLYEVKRREIHLLAGISSRGDGTIIRNNYIEDAAGAGVRLGGNEVSGNQYGVNNQVPRGNRPVLCVCRLSSIGCQQQTTTAIWLLFLGNELFTSSLWSVHRNEV